MDTLPSRPTRIWVSSNIFTLSPISTGPLFGSSLIKTRSSMKTFEPSFIFEPSKVDEGEINPFGVRSARKHRFREGDVPTMAIRVAIRARNGMPVKRIQKRGQYHP